MSATPTLNDDLRLSTPLAQIVIDAPGSERILESFGLDYCCGGQRSLGDACAAAGVDPADVLARLDDTGPDEAPEWNTMAPDELVDHIEATHHAYLHAEMIRLTHLAVKVERVHGHHHPELAEIRKVYEAFRADMAPHLMREEQVLFPMIRELAQATEAPSFHCGSLQNPISVMLREHDTSGEQLARLRELTGGYEPPEDACNSYRGLFSGLAELEEDTILHVHKENNLLFPAVVALEEALAG